LSQESSFISKFFDNTYLKLRLFQRDTLKLIQVTQAIEKSKIFSPATYPFCLIADEFPFFSQGIRARFLAYKNKGSLVSLLRSRCTVCDLGWQT